MSSPAPSPRSRRPGGSLRVRAARGTIVNGAFLTLVNGMAMLRGLVVAGFLTTAEYGVWGVLVAIVTTVMVLKQVGIGDRYVQQDDEDQDRAFHVAFTFELCVATTFALLGGLLVVASVAIYGVDDLLAPGLVMLLALPLQALQFPLAVFYRRMDFARQRTLQAVDPIVAFAVTIGLAAGGAGYWSLVLGTVCGALAAAVVALIVAPIPLRWVLDRAEARKYLSFSWPVTVAGLSAVVTVQGLAIAGEAELGLTGLGIIAVCAQISQVADRADRAITDTMYPAICAVKDRADLLLESFITSNRLALMWAVPFGAGVALFAEDILVRALGEEWAPGVDLLRATAVALAIHQIGFNWTAFYRAQGNTRPLAVAGVVGVVTFLCVVLPLMLADGLQGLALGIVLAEVVYLGMRLIFLRRLFASLRIGRHIARALAPSAVPVAAVLLARLAEPGARGGAAVLGEVALYVALTIGCTLLLERPLLREIGGYLRGRVAVPSAPAGV